MRLDQLVRQLGCVRACENAVDHKARVRLRCFAQCVRAFSTNDDQVEQSGLGGDFADLLMPVQGFWSQFRHAFEDRQPSTTYADVGQPLLAPVRDAAHAGHDVDG
ncbi:hypothetical protein OG900_32075 [Streptomyces sp. NBC_00433]